MSDNALCAVVWLAAVSAIVATIGALAYALAVYANAASLAWMAIGAGLVWLVGWTRRQRDIERLLAGDGETHRP